MGFLSNLFTGVFKKITQNFNPFNAELRAIQKEENNLLIECQRLCDEANARLDALAESELDSPSYNAWVEAGSVRFSVKDKTYEQVQEEYWRVVNFMENKTSTVEGTQQYLTDMANNIGLTPINTETDSTTDFLAIQSQAKGFFDLASKIEQYLKNTEYSAIALDYQAIWQQISTYVHDENIDLSQSEVSIDAITGIIENLIGLEMQEEAVRAMRDMYEEEKALIGQ